MKILNMYISYKYTRENHMRKKIYKTHDTLNDTRDALNDGQSSLVFFTSRQGHLTRSLPPLKHNKENRN